jgi:transcriptional regulator with XRE-family HTH domain
MMPMNVGAELAELSRTIDLGLLGRRIKAARVAAGLTQVQLAAPEISAAYLSRIESGDRRPDLKLLLRFAERTNVPLEQLLVGVNPHQRAALALELDHASVNVALGNGVEAMVHIDRARAQLADSPASDLWLQLRLLEARANQVLGNLDEAMVELEDLLASGASGPHWLAASLCLIRCYLESGDPSACIETGEPLLDLLVGQGLASSDEAAEVASWVAAALRARGDHDRAIELCRAIAESTPASVADQLNAYVAASAASGSTRSAAGLDLAAAFASSARARADHAQAQAGSARFHAEFAELLMAGPDPDIGAASERLALATALATQHSLDLREAASIRLSFAKVLVLESEFDEALRALPSEADLTGSVVLTASRFLLACQIQRGTGNPEGARDLLAEAARVLGEAEGDRAAAQMWYELGAMFDEFGDLESAAEAYRAAAGAVGLSVAQPARGRAVAKRS